MCYTTIHESLTKLDELIEPATRCDPENQLRWSSKITVKLAKELSRLWYSIDQKTVYNLLDKQKYSMKSNRKSQEGKEVTQIAMRNLIL